MSNTGIILSLAYPDTIVKVADEWYSPLLRLIGIGKKNYVRAGHAALVLIDKATGILEYYDFGRYITPEPYGRVRGQDTDNELNLPLKAEIKNNTILNLNEILVFLATHPKITHGEGRMVASVCSAFNYEKAKQYITDLQNQHFVNYAAFKADACNCSRFVTDTLIAGITDTKKQKDLIKSKWFTPSTVGNAILSTDADSIFEVSDTGEIASYHGTQTQENLRCFFDTLKDHKPNFIGNIEPAPVKGLDAKAQWLSGIGSGAWFELYKTDSKEVYRYRRISPFGSVDCDALYAINDSSFNYDAPYQFVHYSNCKFFNVSQNDIIYHFERLN